MFSFWQVITALIVPLLGPAITLITLRVWRQGKVSFDSGGPFPITETFDVPGIELRAFHEGTKLEGSIFSLVGWVTNTGGRDLTGSDFAEPIHIYPPEGSSIVLLSAESKGDVGIDAQAADNVISLRWSILKPKELIYFNVVVSSERKALKGGLRCDPRLKDVIVGIRRTDSPWFRMASIGAVMLPILMSIAIFSFVSAAPARREYDEATRALAAACKNAARGSRLEIACTASRKIGVPSDD